MAAAPLTADFYRTLFDLSGQTVLLTGGYGHLGQAITAGLLAHGAHVVALGWGSVRFRSLESSTTALGRLEGRRRSGSLV